MHRAAAGLAKQGREDRERPTGIDHIIDEQQRAGDAFPGIDMESPI
jgi:hypothetical protein